MQLESAAQPSRAELVQELHFVRDRLDAIAARIQESSLDSSAPITDPLDLVAVNNLIAARDSRRQHFNQDLFAESAWDILVSLYHADLQQRRITASQLYLAIGGAPTTSIRWTDRLVQEGLVTRSSDPADGRRVLLALTDEGRRSMQKYLAAIRGIVPI